MQKYSRYYQRLICVANHAGLQIRLDDVPFATPYTTPALSGMVRPMEAISPQTVNGTTYAIDRWEHGGTGHTKHNDHR